MRTAVILTLALALLALTGCSSLQVSTDYDPNVDFSTYKTFAWPDGDRPPQDVLAQNPLVEKRLIASINSALEAKGYEILEDGMPDLVIITHLASQEKMDITTYNTGYYGGYGGYRGYGMYDPWGYGGTRTDVTYYEQGTLVIDFVDTETKELAWRGIATKVLEDSPSSERVQANIDKVVEKTLAKFPPGATK